MPTVSYLNTFIVGTQILKLSWSYLCSLINQ